MLDWLAVRLGTWALMRLFGTCEIDIRYEYPDDPDAWHCPGCDATRLMKAMRELW